MSLMHHPLASFYFAGLLALIVAVVAREVVYQTWPETIAHELGKTLIVLSFAVAAICAAGVMVTALIDIIR